MQTLDIKKKYQNQNMQDKYYIKKNILKEFLLKKIHTRMSRKIYLAKNHYRFWCLSPLSNIFQLYPGSQIPL
jgi:hypothetical protein